MACFKSVVNNFLLISNHINKDSFCFRIEEDKEGNAIIKKNGWITKQILSVFSKRHSHEKSLKRLIGENVKTISLKDRAYFIDPLTKETTDLFIAAQKYNQTLQKTRRIPEMLGSQLQLPLIQNPQVPELNPTTLFAVKDRAIPEDLRQDKPVVVSERRMGKQHQIRRYPGDTIDHSREAFSIFTSTQKERVFSSLGRILEPIAEIFGVRLTCFQKYHYRSHNETDAQIYSKPISPLSNAFKEPTSYWLGHASLFLSIPLKSQSGKTASFYVITDPVEGDLNAILYPRQTKFARPLDNMPAPDIYLLSHNHLDHYSKESVKKLFAQQPLMFVPRGDKSRYSALAKELGFSDNTIIELDWWEKKEVIFEKNGELFSLKISATPARHWSGQGPCGGHESTFLGYVIEGHQDGDIYFAGDTARLNVDHIKKLREQFRIKWNFQPGGPDEVRKDMESTHQASVDGLWMHFKLMIQKIYQRGMNKELFLKQAQELKTIFMHTMTYKLGNLHLSDTRDSIEKVIKALNSTEIESLNLKSYEKQVYVELCSLAASLSFKKEQKLSLSEVAALLEETVIVPKIGSRIALTAAKSNQRESVYF